MNETKALLKEIKSVIDPLVLPDKYYQAMESIVKYENWETIRSIMEIITEAKRYGLRVALEEVQRGVSGLIEDIEKAGETGWR